MEYPHELVKLHYQLEMEMEPVKPHELVKPHYQREMEMETHELVKPHYHMEMEMEPHYQQHDYKSFSLFQGKMVPSLSACTLLVQEVDGAGVVCGGKTTSSTGDGAICVGEAALSIGDGVGSDGIFG